MASFYFDPKEPIDEFLVPDGWYKAVIERAEYKPTRTGGFIRIGFKITGASQNGRVIEQLLHVDNPNPKAVFYARKMLQKLCSLSDIHESFREPSILIGSEMKIHVGRDFYKEQEQNKVKDYSPIEVEIPASISPKKPEKTAPYHAAYKEKSETPSRVNADILDDDLPF